MSDPYVPDAFRPHVGKVFAAGPGAPPLTLTRIEEGGLDEGRRQAGLRAPFLVLFTGPKQPVLIEGQHRLQTADGEALELYLMPIQTPAQDRQDYQAAFS